MDLSNNFTLEEFTRSATAAAWGINNTPPQAVITTLIRTAAGMELVRAELGELPILISSGYRCPELNAKVGSKPTSQHLKGEAADFSCPAYGKPADVFSTLRTSNVPYDQIILETDGKVWWVHISFSERNRKMALQINTSRTTPG